MFSAFRMLPRFALLKSSLFVLALVTLLLPATSRAQTITAGGAINFTTSDSSAQGSTVSVSGAPGPVKTVQVELQGVTSNGTGNYLSMGYAEFLLQSPSGQQFVLLAATGDGTDGCDNPTDSCAGLHGQNIIIANSGTPAPNGGAWSTTSPQTVEASSYYQDNQGIYPPLPASTDTSDYPQSDGSATLNGRFAGVTANGTWTLYLIDNDTPVDPVSITGWTLTLTYSSATPTTTVLSASTTNPAYYSNSNSSISITYTATVSSGSGTPTGTVTFSANGSTISGCNAVALSSGVAHCTVSLAQGNNSITAEYAPTGSFGQSSASIAQLVEVNAANPSGDQWCNNSVVSDPANDNVGLAYPSVININNSSYNGKTVANVTVELEGLQGSQGINGQYLLVAPGGSKDLVFLQDGWFNDSGSVSAVNLTFDDTASGIVPYESGTPTSGSYLPTDDNEAVNPDTFQTSNSPSVDSSIPQVPGTLNFAPPYGSDTAVYTHTNVLSFGEAFDGAAANGKWALYSVSPGATTLNSGWCITLALNTGISTTTTLSPSHNPATTGSALTFTASVNDANGAVSGGTVTFLDNGAAPAGTVSGNNVVALSGGTATFTTSSLTEGDHPITASFGGTAADNESFSSTLEQRINTATTVNTVNSDTWSYCDPGAVQISAGDLAAAAGPLTPNPSVITVANLPGTLNTVTVTLNGFSVITTGYLEELASLVEGPTGAALDFFSNTTQGAGGNGEASLGNYTFADSAGGRVSSGNTSISPGSYEPTAYINFLSTPDVFTSSLSGFYNVPSFSYAPSHGSSTFADIFTDGSNANGNWSLFFSSNGAASNSTYGAANGWCVNLTENLPALAQPALAHAGAFVQGEQNAAYTVNITNNGPGATGDPTGTTPLTVTDILNSAFGYSGFVGTGWSCAAAGQTVSCTNNSAVAEGSSYPTLTIDVDVADAATGSINNQVSASGAGVTAINSNTDSVTIQPAPVLAVSKSHSGNFTQGATAAWNIQVANNSATSSGATSGAVVTVQDTLPTGYTLAGSSGSGWGCTGSSTVTCTSTQTVAGAGGLFPLISLTVNVPAASPTSVTNNVVVFGGGDLFHTNASNGATASDTASVVQVPASIVVSGGGSQSAVVSTAFAAALTATVEDAGGVPINNVSVTFTAPASGASGAFSNSSNTITVTTNSSGVANAGTFTANAALGGYSVIAGVAGLGSTAAFSLTNTAGAAAYLTIPGGPEPFYTAFGFNIYAYDAVGNLATSYNGTVAFTSSDPGFANLGPVTLVNGVGTATGVLKTAGVDTITATDIANNSITGTGSFTIQPGAAVNLGISAPSSTYAGSPISFTVTAYDLYNNVATGYSGTLAFTSSDPSAMLPGGSTLTNGTGTFSATLETAGTQTISATDAANSLAASSGNISVTIPNLVVTTAADDAGTAGNCTVQTSPGTGTDASCSLRDALAEAAALGSASITFDGTAFASAQTITLSNGTLNLPSNTSINGPALGRRAMLTNLVTVNGNAASTVFTVAANAMNTVIANLIVTNGVDTSGGGGAIFNGYQASLNIWNSTISGSTSNTGAGGIFNDYNANLTVIDSTISGNSGAAGGIANVSSGMVTITSSTLSGNSASNGGGGLATNNGTVTVTNSTIAGNSAVNGGGGIGIGGGTVNVANSIVSGNTPAGSDIGGSITDLGGNLIGGAASLAPLANYGGVTNTMLPLPGSTAICSGALGNTNPAGITADQRRDIFDPNCPAGFVDSGSVQTNYALAFTTNPPSSVFTGQALAPAPVVQLTESGAPAAAATSAVTMTDSASLLGGTTAANLASSWATFNNLTLSAATPSDTLTATLALNATLNITAQSTAFQAVAPVASALLTPAPGSVLTSSNVTFTWSAGTGVAVYELRLGTTGPGSTDIYNSNDTQLLSAANVTVPAFGQTIYAQLYSKINGVWSFINYTYTEAGAPAAATMISPGNGSTLSGSSVLFNWTQGGAVSEYWLYIGTTGPGSVNLYNKAVTTTSAAISGLPTNGSTVYLRLLSRIDGAWQYNDYTYTAASATSATITSPAEGSVLPGASAAFNWSKVATATEYWVYAGTTGPGSTNLYNKSALSTASSATVNNIPTYGETVYVRLLSRINGVWLYNDYTYLGAGTAAKAAMQTPTPSTTLPGSSQTFTWSAGNGVTEYWLYVGTKGVGSADIYNSGTNNTSANVTTLPVNGKTVYVRLLSLMSGVWQYNDYAYIAQ